MPSSELPDVDEMPRNRCRRRHRRADEVRAAAAALPALEVPVRRRGAALAGGEDVRVHAEAHRATGPPPLEAGVLEDAVETFVLRLSLHARGAGDDHRAHAVRNTLS